jgi:hypothetical protein
MCIRDREPPHHFLGNAAPGIFHEHEAGRSAFDGKLLGPSHFV